MAKYQIDEAKRVVRAKSPTDAVGTLPEMDDVLKGGVVYNIKTLEDGVYQVTIKSLNKTWTVRETDKCEYEEVVPCALPDPAEWMF